MRKALFVLLAFVGAVALVEARMPQPRMDVVEAAVDVSTSCAISITSTTYVDVVANSVALSSATILEIFNGDATYSIFCGFDTNVSTDVATNSGGREIQPKVGMYYGVNMDKFSVYCKSGDTGTVAVPRAVITKGR